MNKILLIDGNSLTYRAYFGTAFSPRGILTNSKGQPVNAVNTLFRMFIKTFNKYNPTHVFVAFDAGKKTRRHDKMESYKAGRARTPDELISQFPIVKDMLDKMGIKRYEINEIEADDIIGTLAKRFNKDGEVLVMSSDRDLLQLVDENIKIVIPQNGAKEDDVVTHEVFFNKYGYTPEQVIDMKGLVGDSSDNLPGVQGIGPKTAIKLLTEHKTLEGIYNDIESIKGTTKDKLIASKDMAFLCKEIATLMLDVEVNISLDDLKINNIINSDLIKFFEEHELNSLYKQYSKEVKVENHDTQEAFDNILI